MLDDDHNVILELWFSITKFQHTIDLTSCYFYLIRCRCKTASGQPCCSLFIPEDMVHLRLDMASLTPRKYSIKHI